MTSRRVAYVLWIRSSRGAGHHEQNRKGVGRDRHLCGLLRQLHPGEVHRSLGQVPAAQQRCDHVLPVPGRTLPAGTRPPGAVRGGGGSVPMASGLYEDRRGPDRHHAAVLPHRVRRLKPNKRRKALFFAFFRKSLFFLRI